MMKVVAPYKMPFLIRKIMPGFVWDMPANEKAVYLTFDDGPIPGLTEYVLEMLDLYKARATFFCVGENVRKHPDLFRLIVYSGHSVGNHTNNHLSGWATDTKTYVDNVAECTWEMENAVPGTGVKLFRPPYGKIKLRQARYLKELYKIVLWTILTNDFNRVHSAEHSIKGVKRHTKSGSVVVFHDNPKAETKLKMMLPEILSHLTQAGYQLKGLE